jgi:hypothetical protein
VIVPFQIERGTVLHVPGGAAAEPANPDVRSAPRRHG